MLTWDDTFEIAEILKEQHPGLELPSISLLMIYHWVIQLPEFEDDRELVNDDILLSIYQEWYEEANPI